MSSIKLVNLTKYIKKALILDNISIEFVEGHIYGLKGKNGSGKTMLMRAISGLIFPSSGKVLIDNKELHKEIDVPPSMGMLIENPSFIPTYTGFGNLKLLASLKNNVSEDDVKLAIERVGLDPSDNRAYKKYSLGMKQKLGIANAIMGEPELIILDEPINALDEESVKRIKEVLLELKNKGKIIIIACHDREELEYLSDYIYEIIEGRVVSMEDIRREHN